MSNITTAKEAVKGLLDVIDNENGVLRGNRRQLAILDAEELDKYVDGLEEQIQETEGILYNVDDIVLPILEKDSAQLVADIVDELEFTTEQMRQIDNIVKKRMSTLVQELNDGLMCELNTIEKVYI